MEIPRWKFQDGNSKMENPVAMCFYPNIYPPWIARWIVYPNHTSIWIAIWIVKIPMTKIHNLCIMAIFMRLYHKYTVYQLFLYIDIKHGFFLKIKGFYRK